MEKQRSLFIDAGFFRGLAAITLAFFLVGLAPIVGAVVLIFIPLPVLYYYLKDGRVRGLVMTGLSLSIIFLTLNAGHINLPLLAILSSAGIIIAESLKRNFSIEKTICCSVAAISILAALLLSYASLRAGETPWHLIGGYVDKKIRFTIAVYASLDIAAEQINLIKDNIPDIIAFITRMFPALSLVGMAFMVWVNLLAARMIFQKYGLSYPDFGNLSHWKAPEKMVWYLIVAGVMLLLPDERAEFTGWNLLIVLLFVYLLAGIAIVSFFLKKSSLPAGLKYVVYFLIFAQQIITMLVTAAGLFDLWADFRKLNKTMEDTVA